jgi:hypothetical protein
VIDANGATGRSSPRKKEGNGTGQAGKLPQLLPHLCELLVFVDFQLPKGSSTTPTPNSSNTERTAGIAQPSRALNEGPTPLEDLINPDPKSISLNPTPLQPCFMRGCDTTATHRAHPHRGNSILLRRHSAVLPATHPHRGRDQRVYYPLYCLSSASGKAVGGDVGGVLTIVISPGFIRLAEVGSQTVFFLQAT